MPVWHEKTRELRDAGKLVLIGLTQEQHPERCALFAQWKEFDWPILWDPFNLTDAEVVPVAIGIDEYGVVRKIGLRSGDLDEFLAAEYEPAGQRSELQFEVGPPKEGAKPSNVEEALAQLMWTRASFAAPIEILREASLEENAPALAAFRYGVALRMRYDSNERQADDFQRSLDAWSRALEARPSQYIWRRRIQQWGPALDKPYPFYDWTATAQAEVRERGETPVELRVTLTTSERSGRQPAKLKALETPHPDPEASVPRDRSGWVSLETAVAPNTDPRGEDSGQVHVTLRPSTAHAVHWSNDAGATQIWIQDAEKWGLESAGYELPFPADIERSYESRTFDFMIAHDESQPNELVGTAFYYVCGDREDECRFLAHDFRISFAD